MRSTITEGMRRLALVAGALGEKERGILSIEMMDGQTLYDAPKPGAGAYMLLLLLPLLGFLIPWGAVRAAGWVLTGFVT